MIIMPFTGNYTVSNMEEFDSQKGQVATPFENAIVKFSNSLIMIVPNGVNNINAETIFVDINEVNIKETSDNRRIYSLITSEQKEMLLITSCNLERLDIDAPCLILLNDETASSGMIFYLKRI